ncbi:class I SAM-dependent methyltransferase [Streptomyces niveus]|uniref:class I SAM-dependent methyltransferase n=1 Tax=Streptomyces niveus TaxID=193462 RepID=UPI0004CF4D39|nr:class I SAM-dependent methyltransferase [Streptomyces niveus]
MPSAPMPSTRPLGDAASYFIRAGYRSRDSVEYFADETDDATVWQPDVYPYAAARAEQLGCDALIDIGCGRAGKLAALTSVHPAWSFVGVDFGENLHWCRANHRFGEWIEADLETTRDLPLASAVVKRSLVVCSDVVEHVLDPRPLLALVRGLLAAGSPGAAFSTPAREFRSGYETAGPPRNPSHVREWASDEFQALLRASGFEIHYAGLTRSDDVSNGLSTQLVLVGLGKENP